MANRRAFSLLAIALTFGDSAFAAPPNVDISPRLLASNEEEIATMFLTSDLSGVSDMRDRLYKILDNSSGKNVCINVIYLQIALLQNLTLPPAQRVVAWNHAMPDYVEQFGNCERASGVEVTKRLLPSDLLVTVLPEWRDQAARAMLEARAAAKVVPSQGAASTAQ